MKKLWKKLFKRKDNNPQEKPLSKEPLFNHKNSAKSNMDLSSPVETNPEGGKLNELQKKMLSLQQGESFEEYLDLSKVHRKDNQGESTKLHSS